MEDEKKDQKKTEAETTQNKFVNEAKYIVEKDKKLLERLAKEQD